MNITTSFLNIIDCGSCSKLIPLLSLRLKYLNPFAWKRSVVVKGASKDRQADKIPILGDI